MAVAPAAGRAGTVKRLALNHRYGAVPGDRHRTEGGDR